MTRLEERYRRVLRLLPASYREVWEEDMVSTYLASVDTDDRDDAEYAAEYGWPGWSEVASIVALAVRLRVGSAGAPPRYAMWGEAVRRAALGAMLVNAAASLVGVVMMLWFAGLIPLVPPPPVLPGPPGYPDPWYRMFLFAGLARLLWLPAYLALVLGYRAAGRWLASVAAAAAVLSTAAAAVLTPDPISGEACYSLLVNVLLVLALAAFHRDAPPVVRRSWLAALGVCTVVATGHMLLLIPPTNTSPPLDWAGFCCVVVVGAAVVHLAARGLGRSGRYPVWAPALAILAFTTLGLRLVTLLDYARFRPGGWHSATVPLGLVEAVAVLAVAVWLALLSARTLRRLPATTADVTAWSTTTR